MEKLKKITPLFICFLFFIALSFSISEFAALGERLRDYSLLSAAIENLWNTQEFWLSGYENNYYMFWYKVGAVLGKIFFLNLTQTYFFTLAFCFFIFWYLAKELSIKLWNLSEGMSYIAATAIAFMVNPNTFFFRGQYSWWNLSRVIPGTINEFPIWSFSLGDLHPHFLNLSFLLSIIFALYKYGEQKPWIAISLSGGICLLTLKSNPWDFPIYLVIISIFWLLSFKRINWRKPDVKEWFYLACLFAFGLFVLSTLRLPSSDAPLRLFKLYDFQTKLMDLLRQFGFFFAIILLSTVYKKAWKHLAVYIVGLALGLIFGKAYSFLGAGILITLIDSLKKRELISYLGFVAFGILFGCEFLYFDDIYSKFHERMNTVFKFHYNAWVLLSIYSIGHWEDSRAREYVVSVLAVISLIGLVIVYSGKNLRNPIIVNPLTKVDNLYPGSAAAIKFLETQDHSKIIEGEGQPYSYYNVISTLSGHQTYLGWKNHMDLLYKSYEETGKRKFEIQKFYNSESCEYRRDFMKLKTINFAVLGPMERRRYKVQSDWNCLELVFKGKAFMIYGLR